MNAQDDPSNDVLAGLIAMFREQTGTEPTDKHLQEWMKTIRDVTGTPAVEDSQPASKDDDVRDGAAVNVQSVSGGDGGGGGAGGENGATTAPGLSLIHI